MSVKSKAWQKQIRKEEKVVEAIIQEARAACPNGCLHIVFRDGQLQFLHLPVEAMTRYQQYLFMLEHDRRPDEDELKIWLEAFIQELVVDSRIDYPEDSDYGMVFITLSAARLVAFMQGKEAWEGSFTELHLEISSSFQFGFFRVIPWFLSTEHLKDAMESMEVVLATLGIRVVRNRIDDSENIRFENPNHISTEEGNDE